MREKNSLEKNLEEFCIFKKRRRKKQEKMVTGKGLRKMRDRNALRCIFAHSFSSARWWSEGTIAKIRSDLRYQLL